MKIFDCAISMLFIFLAALVLSACTEKRAAEASAPVSIAQPKKMAKPGAAIRLVSDPLILIMPNQPMQTTIVLANMGAQNDISVRFSPSQGLALGDTLSHHLIENVRDASVNIPITLIATSSGRYYLNMLISVNDTEVIRVRNLAVIVQVGPVVNHAPQFKKTAGENVIVLPTQETISTP
jgi:hypothetical protein